MAMRLTPSVLMGKDRNAQAAIVSDIFSLSTFSSLSFFFLLPLCCCDAHRFAVLCCSLLQELIKPTVRLSENPTDAERAARNASLAVLYTCLDNGLKLLHPFMPFITEELYHRLPGADTKGQGDRTTCGSIMLQPYPAPAVTAPLFSKPALDGTMALLQSIAHTARSTRASLNLTKQRLTMYIRCGNEELFNAVRDNAKDITVMSNAEKTIAMHRYGNATAHRSLSLPSLSLFRSLPPAPSIVFFIIILMTQH